MDIFDQLESNPIMGVIVEEMNPSDDDLVAIAMYIRTLADLPLDAGLPGEWLAALEVVRANQAEGIEFAKTPRDLQVEAVETFASIQATWTRRAREGSLLSHYQTEVIATFDPGEPKFTPEPGKTYWYENVGTTSSPSVLFDGYQPPESNQIVVGDAETKEIHRQLHAAAEPARRGAHLHDVAGRALRLHNRRAARGATSTPPPPTSAPPRTLLKVDALTLQPVQADRHRRAASTMARCSATTS